jgi:small conductance mechanosensitive channel
MKFRFLALLTVPLVAANENRLEDLRQQMEVISSQIKILEHKGSIGSEVIWKYRSIFKRVQQRVKEQLSILRDNPDLVISLIHNWIYTILLLIVFIFAAILFSSFVHTRILEKYSAIYTVLLQKLIYRLPELGLLFLPFLIRVMETFLVLPKPHTLAPIMGCISFITEINSIILIGELLFYLATAIIPRSTWQVLTYSIAICSIRIFRICLRFLILIKSDPTNVLQFDADVAQFEAVVFVIIVVLILIQFRKSRYLLPRFDKVLPYMTGIAACCTVLSYLTNNQAIRFMYKVFMSILTLPLLYYSVSILRNWSFNYIKKLPRISIRKPIEIWLIITNLLRLLTIPAGLFIIMYIFGLNLIIETRVILTSNLFHRTSLILLLYLVSRIGLLINEYLSDSYVYLYAEKRPFDLQRIKTSAKIMKYSFILLIGIIFMLSLLSILGYNVTPLFQTIGLFSAALTFGLQHLIRDLINGICILYENSVKIGDWIDHDGKTAMVEDMSLRYIRVRLDDGMLVTIPFHKLDIIKNKSRYHSYIVYNLSIARSVPVSVTETAVNKAFAVIIERPEFKYKIIAKEIELRDIADVTGFSYVFQFRIPVQPQWQNKIKRAFNRELLKVFEEYEVKIAMPMVANTLCVPSFSTGEPYPDFQ